MRIGIDFDGTLNDSDHYKSKLIKTILGRNIDPRYTNRHECVPLIGKYHYDRIAEEIGDPEVTISSNIKPNAFESITELSLNHDLYVVTAREPHKIPQVHTWLFLKGIGWCFNDIISAKSDIYSSKFEVCMDHGLQIFIDDDERHLQQMEGIQTYNINNYTWSELADKLI